MNATAPAPVEPSTKTKKTKKTNDKVIIASLSQPSAITKNVEIVANVSSSQPATVSKVEPKKKPKNTATNVQALVQPREQVGIEADFATQSQPVDNRVAVDTGGSQNKTNKRVLPQSVAKPEATKI